MNEVHRSTEYKERRNLGEEFLFFIFKFLDKLNQSSSGSVKMRKKKTQKILKTLKISPPNYRLYWKISWGKPGLQLYQGCVHL